MPKRKASSAELSRVATPSLLSLDAALDLLAFETFDRLQTLTHKFETAAGVKLNEGVIKARWEEAVKRYWVMKSMDDLCCSFKNPNEHGSTTVACASVDDSTAMRDDDGTTTGPVGPIDDESHGYKRPLPHLQHRGAPATFALDSDEELQWRKWSPKLGDVVLVELKEGGIWPGKIIEKRIFLQGRQSVPRGNHFFPVRIYSEGIEPTLTVKSRMIPFHLRSSAPLLASEALLGAYNHAANPGPFDVAAGNRESAAAYSRTHPGVTADDESAEQIQKQKESWKRFVNWLMDERRLEKLRTLCEERDRRLKEVANQSVIESGGPITSELEEKSGNPRKRQVTCSMPPFTYTSTATKTVQKVESDVPERGGIFRIKPVNPVPAPGPATTVNNVHGHNPRLLSPMASYIRPALSAPFRSGSPRRAERRRNVAYTNVGDSSPRRRGGSFTPPRGSPSGEEPVPFSSPSPAPTLRSFGFKFGKHTNEDEDDRMDDPTYPPATALEAVLEEREEEDTWTTVANRGRNKRSGSAPADKSNLSSRSSPPISTDDLEL